MGDLGSIPGLERSPGGRHGRVRLDTVHIPHFTGREKFSNLMRDTELVQCQSLGGE